MAESTPSPTDVSPVFVKQESPEAGLLISTSTSNDQAEEDVVMQTLVEPSECRVFNMSVLMWIRDTGEETTVKAISFVSCLVGSIAVAPDTFFTDLQDTAMQLTISEPGKLHNLEYRFFY